MPLVKQLIDIPFTGGRDAKIDPKLLPMGKLQILENAVQENTGIIRKRHGFVTISAGAADPDGFDVSTDQLGSFVEQLLAFDRTAGNTNSGKFFTFAEQTEEWIEKGRHLAIGIDKALRISGEVNAGHNGITAYSLALQSAANMIAIVAAVGSGSDPYLTVIDLNTGAEILSGEELISGGGSRRAHIVTPTTSLFVIVYNNGSKYRTFNVSTLALSTEQSLGSAFSSTRQVLAREMITPSDRYVVVGTDGTSGKMEARFYNSAGASQGTYTSPSHEGKIVQVVPMQATDNADCVVFYWDSTNGLYGVPLDADGTAYESPRQITATVDPKIYNIAAERTGANECKIYVEQDGAAGDTDATHKRIEVATYTIGSSPSALSNIAKTAGLKSNVFDLGMFVGFQSDDSPYIQSTTFLMDKNGDIMGRLFVNEADVLPSLPADSPDTLYNVVSDYFLAARKALVRGINLETGTGSQPPADIEGNLHLFHLSRDPKPIPTEIDGNLFLTGASLYQYDGDIIAEQGWNNYPDKLTVAGLDAGSNGHMALGTYQVTACYAWTDSNGRRVRSIPSNPVSVTLAGSENAIDVDYPLCELTNKQAEKVEIEIYRTLVGGAIFYLAAIAPAGPSTTPTIFEDGVDLGQDDTWADDNPLLYTTGEVLDNSPAPMPHSIARAGNHVFLVPAASKKTIWVSKPLGRDQALAFSSSLILYVPEGGDTVRLAAMDDKIIIFKEEQCRLLTGTGFNNTGQGGFSLDTQIAADVGLEDINSVVLTPLGLVFKSKKGIYLLDRSLQQQYIGAPVEDFNSNEVIDAVLLPDRNEVRMVLDNNQIMVWDYYHNNWEVFKFSATGVGVVSVEDSVIWKDVHVISEAGVGESEVRKQTENIFEDSIDSENTSPINMKIRTGWIHLQSLQGFQRVKCVNVLGDYKSPHGLVVKAFYDYDDVDPVQTVSIPSEKIQQTAGKPYAASIRLHRQKCTAIMFEIEDENLQGTGESLSLNGITLEIGVKKGTAKLADKRTF
jgi:hypothetical protein